MLAASMTWAQGKFDIKVSSDTILLGNYIEVTFNIENTKGDFEAPKFNHFHQIGGPSTSSSISIINGKMTQSQSYTYILEPKDEGLQVIEPAFLQTGEDVLVTDPVEIFVLPNPMGIKDQPSRRKPQYEQEFREPSKPKSNRPITRL